MLYCPNGCGAGPFASRKTQMKHAHCHCPNVAVREVRHDNKKRTTCVLCPGGKDMLARDYYRHWKAKHAASPAATASAS